MNELRIPILNPIRWYEISPDELPQYLTKHFEDYPFKEQIHEWEEPVCYFQKWQNSDVIYQQFISNFSPIQIDIIDQQGNVLLSFNGIKRLQDKYNPTYYAYEFAIALSALPEGVYFLKLNAGGGAVLMISEPLYVAQYIKDTILLEYRNSRYHGDVIFETGIRFGFRVEGVFGRLTPGEDAVGYFDQRKNPTILSSKQFKTFPLHIGGANGIPDWAVDVIANIFSCNDVLIDGKSYAKTSEASYEFTEEENYPMRGITFDVMPGVNRGSKIVAPGVDTGVAIGITYNISSRLFGDLNNQGASNIITITDLE